MLGCLYGGWRVTGGSFRKRITLQRKPRTPSLARRAAGATASTLTVGDVQYTMLLPTCFLVIFLAPYNQYSTVNWVFTLRSWDANLLNAMVLHGPVISKFVREFPLIVNNIPQDCQFQQQGLWHLFIKLG